jgi:hypothetical protein
VIVARRALGFRVVGLNRQQSHVMRVGLLWLVAD